FPIVAFGKVWGRCNRCEGKIIAVAPAAPDWPRSTAATAPPPGPAGNGSARRRSNGSTPRARPRTILSGASFQGSPTLAQRRDCPAPRVPTQPGQIRAADYDYAP